MNHDLGADPREFVATAGAARADREVVADKPGLELRVCKPPGVGATVNQN
jgi:hypothetical protein